MRTIVSLILIAGLSAPSLAGTFEIDSFTAQSTFNTPAPTAVQFSSAFPIVPAVFVTPSIQGGDPSDFRITAVDENGFSVLQVEPPRNDGPHVAMNSTYIAATPGVHTIESGNATLVYEVFCINTSAEVSEDQGTGAAVTLDFAHNFAQTPNIISEIQTINSESQNPPATPSSPFASAGILKVDASQVVIAIERSETDVGQGAGSSITDDERICYLAMEPGRIAVDEPGCTAVIASATSSVIPGFHDSPQCSRISFGTTFTSAPLVVVDKTQRTDDDGGWARICDTNATGPNVTIDQDRTGDNERNHSLVKADAIAASNTCRLEVATPVVIDEVLASSSQVAFSTASEQGALRFSAERYVRGRGFLALTPSPIEARWTRAQGGQYVIDDPYAKRYGPAKRVRIIEFDRQHQRRVYGPFTPRKLLGEGALKSKKIHPLLSLRSKISPPKQWPFSPGRRRINITEPGVYRVHSALVPNLASIGLTLDGKELPAFSYQGDLIFHVAEDVQLPNAVFASPQGQGATVLALGNEALGYDAVYRREIYEEQNLPVVTLPHADDEDFWYQSGLLAGVAGRSEVTIPVSENAIQHLVYLRGASKGDHLIEGEGLSLVMNDFERATMALPASRELSLSLVSAQSALLIDKVESRFNFLGSEDYANLVVKSETKLEVPGHLLLSSPRLFAQGDAVIVVHPDVLVRTSSVQDVGSDMRVAHVDYLAIAPRGFKAALGPLLAAHRQNMSVKFVAAEDIAVHEGDYHLSAQSLGRFIREVSPRFVLLAGDASLDPQGHLSEHNAPLPVKMAGTSSGVFASDQAMVNLSSVAIGRVPARSVEEVKTFVAKTLAYKPSGPSSFVADLNDAGGDFEASAHRLARLVDEGEVSGIGDRNAQSTWAQENSFVHLVGHGASDRFSNTRWLHNDDVSSLGVLNFSPVVVAASCLVNRFELPTSMSLGEQLLFEPQSGASAVIAAGGYTYDGSFNQWHRAFVVALEKYATMGEAMTAANRSMEKMMGGLGYLKTVSLLGDPALATQ